MDAIEFIQNYPDYLTEIREVVKPELHLIIGELSAIDPHDFVKPDTWFPSESAAKGYVWTLFLKKVKKMNEISL